MKMTTGYYSVIQYLPNASRAEAANVGVLLFCPDIGFIDALLSKDNDRIRRFFGKDSLNLDLARINIAKESIKERLHVEKSAFRTLDDLVKFIETRANELRITDPRSLKVANPQDELLLLFKELVGGRPDRRRNTRPDLPELESIFRQPRFKDRIRFNERIEIPIVNREMVVPYAYLNGVLNLIKPQKFVAGTQGVDRAMILAYEGGLLQDSQFSDGMNRKLIVIPLIEEVEKRKDVEATITGLFERSKIRTIDHEAISQFVEQVASEAH